MAHGRVSSEEDTTWYFRGRADRVRQQRLDAHAVPARRRLASLARRRGETVWRGESCERENSRDAAAGKHGRLHKVCVSVMLQSNDAAPHALRL